MLKATGFSENEIRALGALVSADDGRDTLAALRVTRDLISRGYPPILAIRVARTGPVARTAPIREVLR